MIKDALVFTKKTLDQYLKNSFHLQESITVLNHLVEAEGSVPTINQNKVVISLINLEHETNTPGVNRYTKNKGNTYDAVNPPVRFNMDLLFTACFDNYEESLKFLTATIVFFQGNNSLNTTNYPDLPSGLQKLNFHVESMNYNETHNLWTAMGAKYQPSVIYKVRLVSIQSNMIQGTGNLANGISVPVQPSP